MALLSMCCWDTAENNRSEMTQHTLVSLDATVNWDHHRMYVVDNGSCQRTKNILSAWVTGHPGEVGVFTLPQNVGTAKAINLVWKKRQLSEIAVKIDNDVVIHESGWLDTIEEVFRRDPLIGICGLKRKDLEESPDNPHPWYTSKLRMLPHQPGQRWLVIEEVQHVMGTCQAYSPGLLNTIGYLYQGQDEGNLYGFDDSLASFRAHLAGFSTVFLHGIEIDHIDQGGDAATVAKQTLAGRWMARFSQIKAEYKNGTRPLWWEDK